jgi:hypothetical protein
MAADNETAIAGTPATFNYEKDEYHEKPADLELPDAELGQSSNRSSIIRVLISGVALFSDGYTAQIIGYMEPLFTTL